jgi:hypothetical protein
MSTFSRRSFLKTAGTATGAALIGTLPGVAQASTEAAPEVVASSSPIPKEPLVAIVRDAGKHEVTIVAGLQETTYRDSALVKRLLEAARGVK